MNHRLRTVVFFFGVLVALAAVGLASGIAGRAANTVTHTDAALGIAFDAPADLLYSPATAGRFPYETTIARLSSYRLDVPQRPSDLRSQILVEMRTVPRGNKSLAELADKWLDHSGPLVSRSYTVGGHQAYEAEGLFENGPRVVVLIEEDAPRLLVVELHPKDSMRRADFASTVASIRFLAPQNPNPTAAPTR